MTFILEQNYGKYIDFNATKKGKQGNRITSVGAWPGRVAEISTKEQAFFTTNKCETVDSAKYSDQCYCEKKKTSCSDNPKWGKASKQRDKGKGKKDAKLTRDMKRKGFHLTIIIQGVIIMQIQLQ